MEKRLAQKCVRIEENKGAGIRVFWQMAKGCGSKRKKRSYFGLSRRGPKKEFASDGKHPGAKMPAVGLDAERTELILNLTCYDSMDVSQC